MMSPLAKDELNNSSYKKELIDRYWEEETFLKTIVDQKYSELSDEQKNKVDSILKDIKENIEEVFYTIDADYYYTSRFLIIYYLKLLFLNADLNEVLGKHYNMLERYSKILKDAKKVVDNPADYTGYEIELANMIGFVSFLTLENNQIVDDFNILNHGKYTYSDIDSLDNLNDSLMASAITLKSRVR